MYDAHPTRESQVQRLQETHSTLLTSREQQATSHRLQLKELIDQEKARQEELSRCRAQVASLSAELAAERRVSDEAKQQVAVRKAECIKYQTQVSTKFCLMCFFAHTYCCMQCRKLGVSEPIL